MPNIQSILSCYDLQSCFQAVYNLGLVLLFVLAFLNMVYGAVLYLFSAASIFSKEEGKNRIINSIGAIAITLILPQILNIINPGIFQVKLWIPTIQEAKSPVFETFGGLMGYRTVSSPPGYVNYLSPPGVGRNQVSSYDCYYGVPLVKQTDPDYANIRYGDGYIGPSGCGIVSLAMLKANCSNFCNDGISQEEKTEIKNYIVKTANEAVSQGLGGYRGTNKAFIDTKADRISSWDDFLNGIKTGEKFIINIRDNTYPAGHYLLAVGYLNQCSIPQRGGSNQIYQDCIYLKDPANGNYVSIPFSVLQAINQYSSPGNPYVWKVNCGKL
ncbi:hypothetical protein HRbin35_00318 [bacterium HR35]|nr:hypothetical protein HRbin35_00318 [bacterium HR35]